jgi:hypothetical protein
MNKIDLIIDALSVARNSVWSTLNQEALAYAIELKLELAKPEPQVCCGDYEKCIKSCTPRGRWLANQQTTRFEQEKGQFVGGIPEVSQQREWVGLSINEGRDFFESKLTRAELITEINEFLEEKNT